MGVVKFNHAQFEADFRRSHHASEQSAYPVFKRALKAQIQPVLTYMAKYGMPNDALVGLLVPIAPMQAAYRKVYEQVGLKFARSTYYWVNGAALGRKSHHLDTNAVPHTKERAVDFYNEKWRRMLIDFYENESADRIAEVTETTKEEIRRLLAQGVADDLTISEIATLLQSPQFSRARALRIARTESTTAANKGAMIGGGDSDYECGKAWFKIADRNTRPTHMAMDVNNVIGMEDKFVVGGELLGYPGDPAGSAAEVIMCRCSLLIVPLTDSNGLPVLKPL